MEISESKKLLIAKIITAVSLGVATSTSALLLTSWFTKKPINQSKILPVNGTKNPWQTLHCGAEDSPGGTFTSVSRTSKMKVPNGWLYKTTTEQLGSSIIENLVFVLDPFAEEQDK